MKKQKTSKVNVTNAVTGTEAKGVVMKKYAEIVNECPSLMFLSHELFLDAFKDDVAIVMIPKSVRVFSVLDSIREEYGAALKNHPDSTWPKDVIHMTAIMAEEAGEAVRAANNAVHEGKSLEPLRRELAQTAAMCIRCLVHLEDRA